MKHIKCFIDLWVVYWQNSEAGQITKESRCPGYDASVKKIKAKKRHFVEIKNG